MYKNTEHHNGKKDLSNFKRGFIAGPSVPNCSTGWCFSWTKGDLAVALVTHGHKCEVEKVRPSVYVMWSPMQHDPY